MLLTFKTDTLSEIQYKNVLDIFDVSPWKTVVEIFIRLYDLCTTYWQSESDDLINTSQIF